MDEDFKKLYEQRKADLKKQNQRPISDPSVRHPEDKSGNFVQMTPKQEARQNKYMASYKRFLDVMRNPLGTDYKNFRKHPHSLLVPNNSEHSDRIGGKNNDINTENRLHYYFFELGFSKAVSIAFNPETDKYEYHKFDRDIDYEYITETVASDGLSPRTRTKLTHVDKQDQCSLRETLEFETLGELRQEFKIDMADALLRAPSEMAVQIPRSTWAGLRDFGLKKIFALALAGGVLYSCNADAAESPQMDLLTADTISISVPSMD